VPEPPVPVRHAGGRTPTPHPAGDRPGVRHAAALAAAPARRSSPSASPCTSSYAWPP